MVLTALHHEVDMGGSEEEGGIQEDSKVSGLSNKPLAPFIYCDEGRDGGEKMENIGLDMICLSYLSC